MTSGNTGGTGPSQHTFQAPTGTRDFYPAELSRLRYVQDAWRRTSINHGFEEIDGPTFEHLDLYTVKSGEGIVSELFSFERFGGEKKFALRPEFTPTLARMYASKAASLPKPTKWFWMQNCYRAERPQRGRLREFCQWNCDILGTGSDEPSARTETDCELIGCCISTFQSLGLTHREVQVCISDRHLVHDILLELGIPATRTDDAINFLDRRGKLDVEERRAESKRLYLGEDFGLRFDDLAREYEDLEANRGSIAAKIERLKGLASVVAVYDKLKAAGFQDWIVPNPSIVRGLAYYTGMVFEVHEVSGAERAIAGGGRYDKLIEMFGGPPTPAVGFGMGDVVLSLVLQDKGLFPTDDAVADKLGLRPDVFVISNGQPEADAQLAPTLAAIRRAGLHARRSYKTTRNVGKLLGDAVKARARYALIIEGASAGQLKNLETQEQGAVELGKVVEAIS